MFAMRPASILTFLVYVARVVSQQPVVLDDSFEYSPLNPSGIQYFGPDWLTNNTNYDFQRYNQTSHAARQPGNGFIFSFRGSSISWTADRGDYNGQITLQLDGASTSVSNYASSRMFLQTLWTSSTLDDGDHQLLVTNTGSTLIGVDSLVITPNSGSNDILPTGLGPGASSIPSEAILVDDSDSSVTWSGSGWQQTTGGFMQNSSHSTNSPGDSCTFTFTGTQFWYFGNDGGQNAIVNINVDGNQMYSGASTTSVFVQKLLWSSPHLNDGQHTVTVTHAGSLGQYASIEFFLYLPSGASSSGSGGSSGSSTSSSKSVPIGAIIGAVVGGAVVLTLLGGLLVLWANRRKKCRSEQANVTTAPMYEAYPGKEGNMNPGHDHSTLNYRNSIEQSSGYQSPTPMGGAMSGRTNFTASGYSGYPEVQG